MKVLITAPAKQALKDICDYYRSIEYDSYAVKVRNIILDKIKSLSEFAKRGQQEEMLKELEQGHRYLLVEAHFKIIYLVEEKRVIVTDIFDTHLSPRKMPPRNK
jgi:plasmid stabilization system protein ParE